MSNRTHTCSYPAFLAMLLLTGCTSVASTAERLELGTANRYQAVSGSHYGEASLICSWFQGGCYTDEQIDDNGFMAEERTSKGAAVTDACIYASSIYLNSIDSPHSFRAVGVREQDSKLAIRGAAQIGVYPRSIEIEFFVVDPAHQKESIGKLLIGFLAQEAYQTDKTVTVPNAVSTAISFYKKQGFEWRQNQQEGTWLELSGAKLNIAARLWSAACEPSR